MLEKRRAQLISEVGGVDSGVRDNETAWRTAVQTFANKVGPYQQAWSSSTENLGSKVDGDYISSHGYCNVSDGTTSDWMNDDHRDKARLIKDNDTYRNNLLGAHSTFYASVSNKPVFCGEVGACQRQPGYDKDHPENWDIPLSIDNAEGTGADAQELKADNDVVWRYRKAVSTFHYSVWTSLLCKAAGAPLAWCDGKEFGEMKASEEGNSRFLSENYKVDYYSELTAVATLLNNADVKLGKRLSDLTTPTFRTDFGDKLSGFVLQNNDEALVWLVLKNHQESTETVDLGTIWPVNPPANPAPVKGDIRWFNPWTGKEVGAMSAAQLMSSVPTRLSNIHHNRPLAGAHEQEDVILWITRNKGGQQ